MRRESKGGEIMKKLSEHQTGIALGAFFGLMHAVWALDVYLGFAQTWLDFMLGLHFLENPFVVSAFDLQKAAVLVMVTTIVGYVAGFVFAKVWNLVMTKTK
jgi:hypothetical protein